MKNKILRNLFILSAIILAVATSCNKDDDGDGLDFELSLPADWNYQLYDNPVYKYYAWSPERILDDAAGVKDTINEDLIISKQEFPNSNLDGFYFGIVSEFLDDPSFYELSVVDTTINGVNAKKMIHLQTIRIELVSTSEIGDSADLDIIPIKYLFYRSGYGYVVDCGTLPYTHDYYKSVFDDIMSSFKFKN